MEFIKASKVQIYIKKKPRKNTKRCLDFRNVNIYGVRNVQQNDDTEESRSEPEFGDMTFQESSSSGGHEICTNLKNVDKVGIKKSMPHQGPSFTGSARIFDPKKGFWSFQKWRVEL